MLDERWIRSLHVEALRERDLRPDLHPHVFFQASTIGALLEGAYDGDLSFAELAEHDELPPGVDLADPDLASATHAAVELVERPS